MTIKDIAKESGYAVGTVSRVLNNHPDVSEKARETILAVVEKHHFRLNNNAKHLKQQASKGIAIIVKGSQNMLFASIVEQLQGLIEEKDFVSFIYYIGEEENEVEQAESVCLERHPKGIFFLGSNLEFFRERFARLDVPCVLVTNSAAKLSFSNLSSVSTDDAAAAEAAVEYLIRLGHERIGVLGGIDPAAFVDERYRATLAQTSVRPGLPAAEQRMRQMMNLNFKWFMQTLLDRKDRMSMYSGLEVRVPFCDYRIAEYLYSVPWEFKDYHGQEKGLLREAMRGVLPDEVLWRRKSPYPKTWNPSYLAAVSAELRTVLNDPAAPLLRIIRADALETLLASGADNPIPWYGQLMTTPQTIAWFLQLNYWLAKYKVELV